MQTIKRIHNRSGWQTPTRARSGHEATSDTARHASLAIASLRRWHRHLILWTLLCTLLCMPAREVMADCFDAAAKYQHLDATILRAIAWQESGGNVMATHRNTNGTIDYGVMQINSIHLAALSQYGVSRADLMSPCSNVYIAAWYLHRMFVKYGNTWQAVGAYHSQTPAERDRYANAVRRRVARLTMMQAMTQATMQANIGEQ